MLLIINPFLKVLRFFSDSYSAEYISGNSKSIVPKRSCKVGGGHVIFWSPRDASGKGWEGELS